MSTVTVIDEVNRRTANTADLAADYKARGMERHRAWDQLIIDRGLVPGLNAKAFYAIFDSVSPRLLSGEAKQVDFEPTHFDTMFKQQVAIRSDDQGVFFILWADGRTGSNPPFLPPEPERFVSLHSLSDEPK